MFVELCGLCTVRMSDRVIESWQLVDDLGLVFFIHSILACVCSEYGRQVKFTFLDSLFGGQLVSTITCEECKHVSYIQRFFCVDFRRF